MLNGDAFDEGVGGAGDSLAVCGALLEYPIEPVTHSDELLQMASAAYCHRAA